MNVIEETLIKVPANYMFLVQDKGPIYPKKSLMTSHCDEI